MTQYMSKERQERPRSQARWVANLRHLMQVRGFNPRSLSLKAGLNQTAVRDMLEGRTQYPRYDTVQALADTLAVTPAQLMGSPQDPAAFAQTSSMMDDDLDLLTEIIAKLQEVVQDHQQRLAPRDFAAMVTTVYRQTRPEKTSAECLENLKPRIQNLLAYEALRGVARKG